MQTKFAALVAFVAIARAQQACSTQAENHPSLTWQKCAAGGSCSNVAGSVVLDSNWRWTHTVQGSTNCYTGNTWNTTVCSSGSICATNCCVEGADYLHHPAAVQGLSSPGNGMPNVQSHPYHRHPPGS